MRKKLLLIVNPKAGRGKLKAGFLAVVNIFCDAGYDTTVYYTKSRGDATRVVVDCALGYDKIVVCGGDGTVNEAINGMLALDEKRDFGYIPCGSTNDYAATLGLSESVIRAAETIVENDATPIDLGRFYLDGASDGQGFAYIASFGAFTRVSYATPQHMKNQIGSVAYLIGGASELADIRPVRVKYRCDDVVGEGEFVFGAAINTVSLAGFYSFPADKISLDDGMFEVALVRGRKSAFGYTETLLNIASRNYTDKNVLFMRGSEIEFELDEAVPFTLDGEYGGTASRVRVENMHHALDIIRPKGVQVVNQFIGTRSLRCDSKGRMRRIRRKDR